MTQLDEPYGNLAENFDLSLLGDSYDDHDMATVPSPMVSSMESNCHQLSFYASSPSSDFRAFSPECMKQYGGNESLSPSNNSATHVNEHTNNALLCSNNVGQGTNNQNGNSTLENSLSPSNDVGGDCGRSTNVLLRQCLEDTTFQAKYNIKPVDLPTITITDELNDSMMVCRLSSIY